MVQLPRQGPLAVSVVALLVYNNNRPILAFNDVSNVPRDSRKSDTSATIPVPGDDANVHNTNVANGGRHGALNQSKSEDSSAQAETVQSESTDQAESVQTEAEAAQSLASSSYYYNQEQHKHKERYKHHVSKRLAASSGDLQRLHDSSHSSRLISLRDTMTMRRTLTCLLNAQRNF